MVKGAVTERKIAIDGVRKEFECAWVHRSPSLAIIRYEVRRGGVMADGQVTIPPECWSYGIFWRSRRYGCYRFVRKDDASVVAHRFDALDRLTWDDEVIEYHDLVLDWWVLPDDTLISEDADEFEDALASGVMGAADAERARAAALDITSRYRHIVDEVEALQRRYVTGDG